MSLSLANGPHINSGKIHDQEMINDGSVNSLDQGVSIKQSSGKMKEKKEDLKKKRMQ